MKFLSLVLLTFFSGANDVRFSLSGRTYQNNSLVILEDIGDSDDAALLCVTDNTMCCARDQVPTRVHNNKS